MVGQNLEIGATLKLKADAEDAKKMLKAVMSDFDFIGELRSLDSSSFNAHLKQRAYEKEFAKSGDEDSAKAAAGAAGMSDSTVETLGILKDLSNVMKDFGNSIVGFVQGMFGVVEEIYKQMRKSSPLLEMIENLFNLAMQLFFMPLGNKLAEVMLPAIINLLDAVMDIWDKFEGKTLGEMFSIAITEGVQLVASYLMDLGSLLEDEGGIVGSIGSLLSTIGNFLADDGARIIEFLAKVFEFLMDHIGTFIGLAIEFFVASLAIQVGIFAYLMSSLDWRNSLGKIVAVGATTAVVSTGAIGMGTVIGDAILGFAEGGYVPATPGGQIVRVAEGGEGEYIIPESKVDTMLPGISEYITPESKVDTMLPDMIPYNSSVSNVNTNVSTANMGNNVTNNFYFEGLTNDDLRRIIKEEVDNMVSQSKYRSGF